MWFQKDYVSLHHDSNAAITNTAEPAEHKTGKDTMNTATNLTALVNLTNATFPGFGITEIFQNTNGELHTTSEYDLTDEVMDFINSDLMKEVKESHAIETKLAIIENGVTIGIYVNGNVDELAAIAKKNGLSFTSGGVDDRNEKYGILYQTYNGYIHKILGNYTF